MSAISGETGIATVTVRGSAHFGSAGYYARALAAQGKIAMVFSNSEPIVVPHNGREPLKGTNPLAFAAPTSAEPISLAMATSTTAMGWVMAAREEGRTIPATWGVDARGLATTDPREVSALLPVGGSKGYGLAFFIEIMAGVLSGSAFAGGLGNMYNDFDRPQDIGHWMLALDIEHSMPMPEFVDRIDSLTTSAHRSPSADGAGEVLVPGEPEERHRSQRLADGIEIAPSIAAELDELAVAHGLPTLESVNGRR